MQMLVVASFQRLAAWPCTTNPSRSADRDPATAQPRIEAVLMDLPAGLWQRLDRLHAAAVLDQDISDLFLARLFPGEPVRIACDLLVARIETPSVIALACESPTRLTLHEGRPLVRRLLSDLALDPVDIHRAGWI